MYCENWNMVVTLAQMINDGRLFTFGIDADRDTRAAKVHAMLRRDYRYFKRLYSHIHVYFVEVAFWYVLLLPAHYQMHPGLHSIQTSMSVKLQIKVN